MPRPCGGSPISSTVSGVRPCVTKRSEPAAARVDDAERRVAGVRDAGGRLDDALEDAVEREF